MYDLFNLLTDYGYFISAALPILYMWREYKKEVRHYGR